MDGIRRAAGGPDRTEVEQVLPPDRAAWRRDSAARNAGSFPRQTRAGLGDAIDLPFPGEPRIAAAVEAQRIAQRATANGRARPATTPARAAAAYDRGATAVPPRVLLTYRI